MLHKAAALLAALGVYSCGGGLWIACALFLAGLDARGYIDEDDLNRYFAFKRRVGNGVVVFNHPTFYDHVVLMSALQDSLRFAVRGDHVAFPLFRTFARRMGAVIIDPSTRGNASLLREEIRGRAPGQALVAVSPTAGLCAAKRFRTGAFLARGPVLPVVIQYEPCEVWEVGVPLWRAVLSRLSPRAPSVTFRVRVLDAVLPEPREEPEDHAERCRTVMEDAMRRPSSASSSSSLGTGSAKPVGGGDALCFTTSFLFAAAGIRALCGGATESALYGIGMLVVFLTSIAYHGTGHDVCRRVDVTLNAVMATYFGICLASEGQSKPLLGMLAAAIGYLASQLFFSRARRGAAHALLVHVPVFMAFLAIA